MEKILTIDGKEVGFKSSASFLMRYRDYFGADGLKELFAMQNGEDQGTAFITMQRIIWSLAKNYDKKIAPADDWFDSFEEFNFTEVSTEITPLIMKSLGQTETIESSEITTDSEKK